MSSTETAAYTFTVKEGNPSASGKDDAPVWLKCEARTPELSIVDNKGFLGIDLKPGTRFDEAQEIARYLKEHVVGISFTKF
jgi:hypothetical protein